MNDDAIAGRSVRTIAKAQGATPAAANKVIDRWAASIVKVELRKQTLALELGGSTSCKRRFTSGRRARASPCSTTDEQGQAAL